MLEHWYVCSHRSQLRELPRVIDFFAEQVGGEREEGPPENIKERKTSLERW